MKHTKDLFSLDGKVAIVTGGRGLYGGSISTGLCEMGATVVIASRNGAACDEYARGLRDQGYQAIGLSLDLSSDDSIKALVKEVIDRYGKIDILVNNAGIIRDNLLFKITDDDWQQVMDVHLKGAFNSARAAQKYMVEQKYGRIITISSTSALGNRGQSNYSAAKAGLQGLTKTLAVELGKFGITANSVAPGFIETEMTKATAERVGIPFEDFVKGNISKIPVGRSGKPEDIANAVAFFADERSSFVSGQVIYVAGGPRN